MLAVVKRHIRMSLILLVLVAVIAITAWTEIGGALIEKIRYATDAIASLGA